METQIPQHDIGTRSLQFVDKGVVNASITSMNLKRAKLSGKKSDLRLVKVIYLEKHDQWTNY